MKSELECISDKRVWSNNNLLYEVISVCTLTSLLDVKHQSAFRGDAQRHFEAVNLKNLTQLLTWCSSYVNTNPFAFDDPQITPRWHTGREDIDVLCCITRA